jgi:DNA-binding Lrp family transcriptional regulator
MVLAVVLINVKAGKAEAVLEAVENIDMVTKANMVTGPFDIIAYAELPSRVDFRKLINSLHEIDGLTKTETCVGLE